MSSEILTLIASITAFITVMVVRLRFYPAWIDQRIQNKLSHLKVSAPNLNSTYDSSNSMSP